MGTYTKASRRRASMWDAVHATDPRQRWGASMEMILPDESKVRTAAHHLIISMRKMLIFYVMDRMKLFLMSNWQVLALWYVAVTYPCHV
jgi:hypothetical protein